MSPVKDSGLLNENRAINPEEFEGNTLGGKVGNTFVRTFKKLIDSVTDWFEDRLVNFSIRVIQKVETSGSIILADLLKELKDKKVIPTYLKPLFDEMENPQNEFGAMLLSTAQSSAIGGIMGAIFDPLMAGVKYQLNSLIKPYLPGIGEAIAENIRSGVGDEYLELVFKQNGYNPVLIPFYKTLARTYLDTASINDAENRGILTESECITRLKSLGFIEDDAKIIYQLFTKIPDINSSIQAFFRGDIAPDKLNKIAEQNDIKKEYLDILISANRTILNLNDIRDIYYRDHKDDKWLMDRLTALGLLPDRIEDLKKIFPFHPPVQDLVSMADRLCWDEQYVKLAGLDADRSAKVEEEGAKVGISPEWIKMYWRQHWLPIDVSLGFEMLHRDVISMEEMKIFLKAQHIPPALQEKYIKVAYNPLTRVDTRRMYNTGVMDEAQVLRAYKNLGYNDENANFLLEYTKRAKTTTKTTEKELTRAEVIDGYKRKFFTAGEVETFLAALGYDSEEVKYYIAKADYQEQVAIKKEYITLYAELYKKGLVDDNKVITDLSAVGFESAEIQNYLKRWLLAKTTKITKPSVLDLKNWLKAKIIPKDYFAEELSNLGYSDLYIMLYYKEVTGKEYGE